MRELRDRLMLTWCPSEATRSLTLPSVRMRLLFYVFRPPALVVNWTSTLISWFMDRDMTILAMEPTDSRTRTVDETQRTPYFYPIADCAC